MATKKVKKEVVEEVQKNEENIVLKPIEAKCIDCGKSFIITPADQKYFHSKGFKIPTRCETCRNDKNDLIELVCVDCGAKFNITKANERFFKRMNLAIPKRCESCMKFKKERNAN